ncbi:MAG: fibronectin type III domain-containing protein [Thaumarchaeota archaeon]|nr:fibronectin type III domain-containing protein [Nitrososphaerota archaeon]
MKGILYFIMLASIIITSTLIPAFAEVVSFKTDSTFYKGGSSIAFSGTVLSTDSHSVTIVIFDPNNKFVTLTSALADSSNSFQAVFDTSTTAMKNLLTLKGVYNATAFVTNQAAGKTVSFVFSPDGSPVTPSPPTNLTATAPSSTEVDLNWLSPQNNNGFSITGYQIDRNDGSGFYPLTKSQATSYRDIGLIPNSEHAYRVSAINAGGASLPSKSVVVFTLTAPVSNLPTITSSSPPSNSSTTPSIDELIKQRIADAQRLQALLNGQTSGQNAAPSTTQSSPSVTQQNINLSENVDLGDISGNPSSQKSSSAPQNNLQTPNIPNLDIKNIIYPVISLVGAGIVATILYLRKKRKITGVTDKVKTTATMPPVETVSEEPDDDYAMAILKNRLAKGEITIDEFKTLKDELSEP